VQVQNVNPICGETRRLSSTQAITTFRVSGLFPPAIPSLVATSSLSRYLASNGATISSDSPPL
jgi:hypothetical protein